ncbi:MAG: hypothetical protein WA183_06340 [Chthoniobacterales bacterium]
MKLQSKDRNAASVRTLAEDREHARRDEMKELPSLLRGVSRARMGQFIDRQLDSLVVKWIRTTKPDEWEINDFLLHYYLRLAISTVPLPLWVILHDAANRLDDDHLKTFVRKLGTAFDRGIMKKPLSDLVDRVIHCLLDGFDLVPPKLPGNLSFLSLMKCPHCGVKFQMDLSERMRRFPPLPRWALPAAHQCVAFFVWNLAQPSARYIPTYRAYCKRMKRNFFKTESPILVTKAKFDQSKNTLQVILADGLFSAATQISKDLSHTAFREL